MAETFCKVIFGNPNIASLSDPQHNGYLSADHLVSFMRQELGRLSVELKAFPGDTKPAEIATLEGITGPMLKADFLQERASLLKAFPKGVQMPSDAQFASLAGEIQDIGFEINRLKESGTLADAVISSANLGRLEVSDVARAITANASAVCDALSPSSPQFNGNAGTSRPRPR